MNPEALRRHARRQVPRYTSYPTAPHFTAAVGEADYRAWLAALRENEPVSLYVHVPFCRSMCWYCGCHTSVTTRQAPIEAYMKALHHEVALVADALPERLPAGHVHFGGGSPGLIEPATLLRTTAVLREHFRIVEGAEIAIEIDPRTMTAEMADALAAAGVNRASIGVQSFDAEVQRAINRVQSFEDIALCVARLRGAGVASISFDLIYGLPHQDLPSCLDTAAKAVSLSPDRISLFGYAHVPSFKPHQRKISAAALPGVGERLDQFEAMARAFEEAGYRRIGLDHFALPADDLYRAADQRRLHRNFQGYTADPCRTLIGFGASAIGRLPGGYIQNAPITRDYLQAIAAGCLPVARGCRVGPEDALRGAIIERLMCDFEVDLAKLCARFGGDPAALTATPALVQLAREGLVERRGTLVSVTAGARPLVRTVAAAFDAYLQEGEGRHAPAV